MDNASWGSLGIRPVRTSYEHYGSFLAPRLPVALITAVHSHAPLCLFYQFALLFQLALKHSRPFAWIVMFCSMELHFINCTDNIDLAEKVFNVARIN